MKHLTLLLAQLEHREGSTWIGRVLAILWSALSSFAPSSCSSFSSRLSWPNGNHSDKEQRRCSLYRWRRKSQGRFVAYSRSWSGESLGSVGLHESWRNQDSNSQLFNLASRNTIILMNPELTHRLSVAMPSQRKCKSVFLLRFSIQMEDNSLRHFLLLFFASPQSCRAPTPSQNECQNQRLNELEHGHVPPSFSFEMRCYALRR